MSQSAWSAVCPRVCCLTSEPKTSEQLSFSAPDWPWYCRPFSSSVTPCAELVADDVQRPGEAQEQLAVAVAEHHAPAVPERVVVVLPVVDDAAQRHALVVDRVAPVGLEPEVVGRAEAVVGLVGRGVAGRRLALCADDRPAHDLLGPLGVADLAVGPLVLERGQGVGPLAVPAHAAQELVLHAGLADRRVQRDRAKRPVALRLRPVSRDAVEHRGRDDAAAAHGVRARWGTGEDCMIDVVVCP